MKTNRFIRAGAIILVLVFFISALSGCSRSIAKPSTSSDSTLAYKTIGEYIEYSGFRFPEADDDFYYRVYDRCAIISKCLSDKAELTIPALYRGVPVVGIYSSAFKDVKTLRKITLGSNQLWIGAGAFSGCTGLTTVIMSGTINQIDESAFSRCDSLCSIIVPSGIKKISNSTFAECSSLKKVIIEPYTKEQMNDFALNETAAIKTIESGAFSYCKNLAAIWLPSDISVIANNSFSGNVRPVVYGAEQSMAALFAADNLLSFVITTREGFDAAARLYKPLSSGYVGSGIGQTVMCGDFSVVLDDAGYYKKLGSAAAGDKQTLLALTFSITNTSESSKYFEGFDIKCKSLCKDKNGDVQQYAKCPIIISSDILSLGYPTGSIIGGTTMQGIIVLRVNENFEAVTVSLPNAESDFVISGRR